MKVIFIPYSGERNPYQKLLREHLQNIGVKVEGAKTYRIFSLLRAVLGHGKPDILHLHWHHPFLIGRNALRTVVKSISFFCEVLILKLSGIKIVWTVHNIISHEEEFKSIQIFFSKILAYFCNKIIVHGPSAKKKVMEAYGIDKSSLITVIPHGNFIVSYKNVINKMQARRRLQLDRERIIFLYFGNIRLYKGLPELIEAFKKLDVPRVKLLIVGRPHNNEIANDILLRCNRNENIKTIFEFISDVETHQIYMNAADVVVLPFRDVLTSSSLILAISFGKAIIAPAIGCILDVLDSEGGFLYDPSSENGLLKAMKKALNADLEKMGRYNFELAKQLRWDESAKKTYNVYRKCLRMRRKR